MNDQTVGRPPNGQKNAFCAVISSPGHVLRVKFTVLIEGASGPQPHPSFIEVFDQAAVRWADWALEGAWEDGSATETGQRTAVLSRRPFIQGTAEGPRIGSWQRANRLRRPNCRQTCILQESRSIDRLVEPTRRWTNWSPCLRVGIIKGAAFRLGTQQGEVRRAATTARPRTHHCGPIRTSSRRAEFSARD
jgi:hypothetical protein